MEKRDGVRKALDEIDEQYVDEAGATKLEGADFQEEKMSKSVPHVWPRYALTAAGVLLVLGIGTVQIMKHRERDVYTEPTVENSTGASVREDALWYMDGRMIRLEDGGCMVYFDNSGPVQISTELGADYTTGDLVRVYFTEDGRIRDAWPGQATGVSRLELLEEGTFADLDVQLIERLAEYGWIVCQEAAETQSAEDDTSLGNDEPIVLEVFNQTASFRGVQKGWIADVLKEKFNVEIEIVADPDGSRMSRGLETGDLGDIIIWGIQWDDYKEAIAKGYLLDWNRNDLLSIYGADIKENLAAALEYNAEATDGVIYGFVGNVAVDGSSNKDGLIYTWDIRWDLYEKLGKPVINDLDDCIALLKAMKELEPTDDNGNETYALGIWPDWDENMLMYVKAFASAYYGYDEWGMGLYDVHTGDVHGVLEEEGPYYTSLQFMNRLYREGLLDPDSRTQKYDAMVEKMQAGRYFFSIFSYAGQDIYNTEKHIDENKMMCSLIPNDAAPLVGASSLTGMGSTWTIASQTEYPELCMQIINWLATPEGTLTHWYGPQGACWDYDADGNLYLTELGLAAQTDKMGTDMSKAGYSGTFTEGCLQINANIWNVSSLIPNDPKGQSFLYTLWDSMQQEPSCETEASWRAYTGESRSDLYLQNNENAVRVPWTGMLFGKPGNEYSLQDRWEQVAGVIVEGSWDCIYAETEEEFEQLWMLMTAKAQEYGYDECIDFTQKQADTRYEAEQRIPR